MKAQDVNLSLQLFWMEMANELRNDCKEKNKNDFQSVVTYSRVLLFFCTDFYRPKAARLQMTVVMHSGVFCSLNMHNLRQQSN